MIFNPSNTLKEHEREIYRQALIYFDGNKTHVAKALGVGLRTVRNKIHEHKLYEFYIEPSPKKNALYDRENNLSRWEPYWKMLPK